MGKLWCYNPAQRRNNSRSDMHKNITRLRNVMRRHSLTDDDVAKITKRSPTTVAIWRCASEHRMIPAELLKLVELTAKARAHGRRA